MHLIVYIPADHILDGQHARMCLDYLDYLGVSLWAIIRDPDRAKASRLDARARGYQVEIITYDDVLAARANEDTRDLRAYAHNGRAVGEETIRRVLYEDATPPLGIDATTIDAARRIARGLNARMAS